MIRRLATLLLPLATFAAAFVWAPGDDWRAALGIALFWFALLWGHGYRVLANLLLIAAAGIWIGLQPDVTTAFFLGLAPFWITSILAIIRSEYRGGGEEQAKLDLLIRSRNPVGGRGAL
jgi:hypothetical protein